MESTFVNKLKLAPNLVKVREDDDISMLSQCVGNKFTALEECPLGGKGAELDVVEVRRRVEPWLTALFQSEHLSLLIGTGLTTAACNVIPEAKARGMDNITFMHCGKVIKEYADLSAKDMGRGAANFEDSIRVANDLVRGLKILGQVRRAKILNNEIQAKLSDLVKAILENETVLDGNGGEEAWNLLGNFLLSFAARVGGKDRLNLFTTNYDRVLEETADRVGVRFIDRFVGALEPVFRSSRLDVDYHYNPPGIRGEPRYLEGVVRFTKLHGSLDWFQSGDKIIRIGLPFGAKTISPYLEAANISDRRDLIIYPNSSKDRETAEYPYVDLFRDFAAAICRPNSTLVTYGYGFGDSHINRIIEDSLSIASTHLVIISYDLADGRIASFYERNRAKAQISLLVGKNVAGLKDLVLSYLPKPAIDTAMSRLAKNLEARTIVDRSNADKPFHKEPLEEAH